jgi:hypothetical protein
MKIVFGLIATLLAAATAHDTICVKYTKALFGNDTADNELSLMKAVVNLALLGNSSLGVAGILAPGGGLRFYFTGAKDTTNINGTPGKENFLDASNPANPAPSTNTYVLLTHLYQFFGGLLGCTANGFPSYKGDPDMYRVHKFMRLQHNEVLYFNRQVTDAASALGVAPSDVYTIGNLLNGVFNKRCTPPLTSADGVPSFLVGTDPSICTSSNCPIENASYCPGNNNMTKMPQKGGGELMTNSSAKDTICVKYTKALFGNDTADNEVSFIRDLVNLAMLGNSSLGVSGILAPEESFLAYFTEDKAASSANGKLTKMNSLDSSNPANPASSTSIYMPFELLYRVFGTLLSCTAYGYPSIKSAPDMCTMLKFMTLTDHEVTYFIKQVTDAASAMGVSGSDVASIENLLLGVLSMRCTPP